MIDTFEKGRRGIPKLMKNALIKKFVYFVLLNIALLIISCIFSFNEISAEGNEVIPSESFELGTFTGSKYIPVSGIITNDPKKVVTGSYSAHLTSPTTQEWKEFANTDFNKVKFERNTTYAVTFSYKSIDMQSSREVGFVQDLFL